MSLCATIAALPASAQTQSYDDVMLVINERSWASREIGAYFATRRSIPARNIYRINIDTSESIDSSRFQTLRWQMQEWMRTSGIVDSINYIVTTKGCPLRVRTSQRDVTSGQIILGGQASFEDCIALMNGQDSTLILSVKLNFAFNRYYASKQRFKRNRTSMPIYLVTRLDAYTVDEVKSYLLRAETPATLGDGLWVLDGDPTKEGNPGYRVGNDWLRGADDTLRNRGMDVLFNIDSVYVHDQRDVIGYASWGSNDAYSGGRGGAPPRNTWVNGSLAETFVSTGGRTFNPGSSGGQSLIADWVTEGACGVKGYTDEPYLSAIAHPNILFDRYTAGFNMAESFWAASQFCAWRQVVIGDPKMKLNAMLRLSIADVDFGIVGRGQLVLDTITVTNNVSAPVMINAISIGGDEPGDFVAMTPGRTLPSSIAAGGSFTLVVGFQPAAYGTRSAIVNIAHRRESNPRDNIMMVQVQGRVAQPSIAAPSSYDFGAVAIGDSGIHILELTNTLPSDTLKVSNYSKNGAGSSRFTVTTEPALPASLTGAQSLAVRVAYAPSGSSRDSATLIVYTINGGQPARIKLYGTGALSSTRDDAPARSRRMTVSPNPGASIAAVHFVLEHPASVRIELTDLRGRSIRVIADRAMSVGEQNLPIDVSALTSGSYLCRVEITNNDGSTRTEVTQIIRQ